MTLNGVMALICIILLYSAALGTNPIDKWLKTNPYSLRQKFIPKNLVFSNMTCDDICTDYLEWGH